MSALFSVYYYRIANFLSKYVIVAFESQEEDYGAGYFVQPVGQAEAVNAVGGSMNGGDDDGEDEEEVDDDDDAQVLPPNSLKRKRDDDEDDGDDDEQ